MADFTITLTARQVNALQWEIARENKNIERLNARGRNIPLWTEETYLQHIVVDHVRGAVKLQRDEDIKDIEVVLRDTATQQQLTDVRGVLGL